MNTLTEYFSRVLVFEAVAFVLSGSVLICRRFFHQPIDRIRLIQFSVALTAATLLPVGSGIGPKWSLPWPRQEQTNHPVAPTSQTEQREEIQHDGIAKTLTPTIPQYRSEYPLPVTPVSVYHSAPTTRSFERPENEAAISVSPEIQEPSTATILPIASVESPVHAKSVKVSESIAVFLFVAILLLPPLVLLARDLSGWRRLGRMLRRSSDAPEAAIRSLEQIRGASRRTVSLKMSDEIATPIVFGVFRATLLLPVRLCNASAGELNACLAHEWSHLKNGDLATWNVVRLFQYILWMQPFYWVLRSRLLADQDFLADDDGIRVCSDIADYAQILLALAKTRTGTEPGNALGMAGRKSQLRRRIEMLMGDIRPTRASNKRKLLGPLLLLSVLAWLGGTLRFGESVGATETTPEKRQAEKTAEKPQGPADLQPLSVTRNADKEFTVSGILYDKDGKPAIGAAVLLYEDQNSGPTEIVNEAKPVRTDENGSFELKSKKMFAILGRSADGSDFFFHRIPQKPDEAKPEERAPVAKLVRGETLTGQVVGKENKPVEGATVGYYTQYRLNGYAKSDAAGHFTLYHPKGPEIIAIFALKSGKGMDYDIFRPEFDEVAARNASSQIDLSQPFTLKLTGAKTVRIKAQWEDGTPAPGITVAPWTLRNPAQKKFVATPGFADPSFNFALIQYRMRKETDANGVVEFDWMPDWLDRVGFFYADFPWWTPSIPWLRFDIDIKTDSHEKTLILHRKRKASGIVRFPDGKPAEGITVKYEGANLNYESKRNSVKTGADGRYEIDIEPEVAYVLSIDSKEWGASAYNPLVVNAATKPEELQRLDFTLRKTTKVHGKVAFGPEKKILSGYKVHFTLRGKSDETLPKEKQLTRPADLQPFCGPELNYGVWRDTPIDANGDYSIQLGPGEYEVGINENYIGMKGLVRDLLPDGTLLTIPDNAEEEIVYDIEAGASKNGQLSGQVLLADGSPAAGIKLVGVYLEKDRTYESATPEFSAETDAEGNFSAPRTLQTMQLHAKSADGKQQAVVELDAETQTLATPITLKPTGSATGRIVDMRGNPLPGVEFTYGVLLYELFDKENWHDARQNISQRIRVPLRFGGTGKSDVDGRFRIDSVIADHDCYLAYRASEEHRLGMNDTFQLAKFKIEKPGETYQIGDCRLNPVSLDGWKQPDAESPAKFTAQFLDDKTGKPVPGVRVDVEWSLRSPSTVDAAADAPPRPFTGQELKTDANGKVEFTYPKAAAVYDPKDVSLGIACFCSFPAGEDWNLAPYLMFRESKPGPFETTQNFTFKLIPYEKAAGKILDPDGKSVKGASLKITTSRTPTKEEIEEAKRAVRSELPPDVAEESIKGMEQRILNGSFTFVHKEADVVTDAEGKFVAMVAPDFNQGALDCNAPGFVPCRIDLKGLKIDRSEDWTFTARKGTDVPGRVVDSDGKGIPDVWVNFERRTTNGKPLGVNIHAIMNDQLGRSVKTGADGGFVAPSLDKEEYAIQITSKPTCPNAENAERAYPYGPPPTFDEYVFPNQFVDLRTEEGKEETKPEAMTITGHPTVALKFVWIDETKEKSALSYSHLSFHGRFPDTESNWSVQTQGKTDPRDRGKMSGTVHVPKGLPLTFSVSLIDSIVREGVRTISNEKREWTLEYRLGSDCDWKPCTEMKPDHSLGYTYMDAALDALYENDATLEIRVR